MRPGSYSLRRVIEARLIERVGLDGSKTLREFVAEPAFADAARTAQREHAHVGDKPVQFAKVTITTHEAVGLGGKIAQPR